MNYSIIKNEKLLDSFIEWLPELQEDECYYLCLFARSKYAKNEDGSNKFPHIKTDKAQLKRVTVHKKSLLKDKIRQMECAFGSYKTKDNEDIPQEALALYITPNPRNQKKAMFQLMKRLIDMQIANSSGFNIHAEAMSAIQKSKSRTVYIDFDLDIENLSLGTIKAIISNHVNLDAVTFLKTRGGFHILINPEKVNVEYKNKFYQGIQSIEGMDQSGDNMIPVPGCAQGDFIPHFEN